MSGGRERVLAADPRTRWAAPAPVASQVAPLPGTGPRPAFDGDAVARFVAKMLEKSATLAQLGTLAEVGAASRAFPAQPTAPDRRLCVSPALTGIAWPAELDVQHRAAVREDETSVTPCFAAVAESGGIVTLSGPDTPSTLNFVPDNHIVVVHAAQVVRHFEDVWAQWRAAGLAMPRTLNIISGPVAHGRHRADHPTRRARAAPAAHPAGCGLTRRPRPPWPRTRKGPHAARALRCTEAPVGPTDPRPSAGQRPAAPAGLGHATPASTAWCRKLVVRRRERGRGAARARALCRGTARRSPSAPPAPACRGRRSSDSVLVLLGDGWRGMRVVDDGATIALQPGVIGAAANRRLAPLGPQDRPRPGLHRRRHDRRHRRQQRQRHVLRHGAEQLPHAGRHCAWCWPTARVLDTRDAASRAAFAAPAARPAAAAWPNSAAATRADASLAQRIRHKFRLKNTCGYSLNALVDFDDPVDILSHLMIGSEGTLGFISEITYFTVEEHAHKASALILFDRLETACSAVSLLKHTPVAAVELLDRASLRSVQDKPGMPASLRALPPDGAALLVEIRAETPAALSREDRRRGHAAGGARRWPRRCASPPTPPNPRRCGTCARACSRPSARCGPPAPR